MRCTKCTTEKDASAFYAKGKVCKACRCAQVSAHRLANVEKARAYDRSRSNLQHRVEARVAYRLTEAYTDSHRRACDRYIENYPERRAAQIAVGNAVRDGRLIRPATCSVDGCSAKPEAHHPDYSQPLVVEWLCDDHHKDVHVTTRDLLRPTESTT